MANNVTLRQSVFVVASAVFFPCALLVACADDGTNPIPVVPPFTPLEAGPDTGAEGGREGGLEEGGPDGDSTTPASDSGGSTTDGGSTSDGGEDASSPTPTDGSPD